MTGVALDAAGLGHVRVGVGGIVPDEDEADLLSAGISKVFHPGAVREEIVSVVEQLAIAANNERPVD